MLQWQCVLSKGLGWTLKGNSQNREEYVGHRQGERHFHAPEASGEKAEGKCWCWSLLKCALPGSSWWSLRFCQGETWGVSTQKYALLGLCFHELVPSAPEVVAVIRQGSSYFSWRHFSSLSHSFLLAVSPLHMQPVIPWHLLLKYVSYIEWISTQCDEEQCLAVNCNPERTPPALTACPPGGGEGGGVRWDVGHIGDCWFGMEWWALDAGWSLKCIAWRCTAFHFGCSLCPFSPRATWLPGQQLLQFFSFRSKQERGCA